MLGNGEWRAETETKNMAGFWINELYSPFTTWGEMAADFVSSKPFPEQLKVFINTRLAQTWENDGEKIDYADLSFHQEEYEAEIPAGVMLLTAGVDVQDDRLELEVVGWGQDFESWSIDYKIIYGNPANNDIWDELKSYLMREFTDAEENVYKIRATAIDSGGHHTQKVYDFVRANTGRKFFAIKGANISGKPIVSRPNLVGKNRVRLFTVGTEAAKDMIFSNLKVEETGPGYCHFPISYESNYFRQLCAEKKITKFVAGKSKQIWVKVSANARNEALDCRVYAVAAVRILNPDFKSYSPQRTKIKKEAEAEVKSIIEPKPRRVGGFISGGRRSGFATNWRK